MTQTARLSTTGGRMLLVTLLTLAMLAAGFVRPAAAAPSGAATASGPVTTLGCQSSSSAFKIYGSAWSNFLTCSGTYDFYRTAERFEAGGWSGIVYYGTSSTWAFCDWENWDFPYYTRYVVLYETKASWC